MSKHESPELLPNQVGSLASKRDPRAFEVGLDFVESPFDLPALMVQGGKFGSRRLHRVQDVRD